MSAPAGEARLLAAWHAAVQGCPYCSNTGYLDDLVTVCSYCEGHGSLLVACMVRAWRLGRDSALIGLRETRTLAALAIDKAEQTPPPLDALKRELRL